MSSPPGNAEKQPAIRPTPPGTDPRLDPSRWWFASSAFPMIAGTLGPVASAFSICALVRPWRQSAPLEVDVISDPSVSNATFMKDPPW